MKSAGKNLGSILWGRPGTWVNEIGITCWVIISAHNGLSVCCTIHNCLYHFVLGISDCWYQVLTEAIVIVYQFFIDITSHIKDYRDISINDTILVTRIIIQVTSSDIIVYKCINST